MGLQKHETYRSLYANPFTGEWGAILIVKRREIPLGMFPDADTAALAHVHAAKVMRPHFRVRADNRKLVPEGRSLSPEQAADVEERVNDFIDAGGLEGKMKRPLTNRGLGLIPAGRELTPEQAADVDRRLAEAGLIPFPEEK